ncbi:MAG: hypothetical protein WCP31_07440, partial [Chloroflexales bacterium]
DKLSQRPLAELVEANGRDGKMQGNSVHEPLSKWQKVLGTCHSERSEESRHQEGSDASLRSA